MADDIVIRLYVADWRDVPHFDDARRAEILRDVANEAIKAAEHEAWQLGIALNGKAD